MMEKLRQTSRKTAKKPRHEYEIEVDNRVLISLRRYDAVTLSALPDHWHLILHALLWFPLISITPLHPTLRAG